MRDAVENNWPHALEIEEHSHAAMANAYEAGAAGLPCAIFRGYRGAELARVNANIKFIECPFTGERLAAVPAIRPDVTFIHAQKADRKGNVLIEGIVGVQKEAVLAAKRAVITVEEVVDNFDESASKSLRAAALDNRRDRRRAGRRPPFLHERLLWPRQRIVSGVGRDRRRSRPLPRMDARNVMKATPGDFAARVERIEDRRMSVSQNPSGFTPDEMMTIAASRALKNDDVCFVGIGAPSAACNVARLTHAPAITLIYESGTIGTAPDVLPLSIGDGELSETALTTVAVPEMFRYWLQGGRVSIGFLGAAQLDKFGNINTTVIGDYAKPKTRLPGGGGAPEIATSSGEIYITMKQSLRAMVEKIDFYTSFGHGDGGDHRKRLGIDTKGPTLLITDLAVWRPDPQSKEFTVTSLHPGVTREDVQNNCGWKVSLQPSNWKRRPRRPSSN